MSKFRTTIQPADRNPEIAVVVEYAYHKGSPGRLSGPPENCYPPEPAYIEITSVKVGAVEIVLSEAETERLAAEIEDAITEQAAADEQDHWDNVRKDARYPEYWESLES